MSTINSQKLTPRQSTYIERYTNVTSPSFGNAYQSAISAGYSSQTASNITHLKPRWLSETIGSLGIIKPDEIMQELTSVIHSSVEPTVIRLRAMELSMKAYSMLQQNQDVQPQTVHLSVNLIGE